MTHFEIEKDLDELSLFSISSDESQTLIKEIRSVGTIETKTNQLLIVFRSDCDTSLGGFRGILTAVKSES